MLYLTLARGQRSHPLDHNGECRCGADASAGFGSQADAAYGDRWTDAPIKRLCQHPACVKAEEEKGDKG